MTRSSTRRVATENPWAGRQGWAVEDELPILYREVEGEGGRSPRNRPNPLTSGCTPTWSPSLGSAPFRDNGEPRGRIPTPYGR